MVRAEKYCIRPTRFGRCLLRIILGILLVPIGAFGVEGDSTFTHQPYVWIQDPWDGDTVMTRVREPDYSLWNAARIEDYEHAMQVEAPPALGVLTIPALELQVPIYNGTDDFTLDRGAGRIKGMAKTGEAGNLGISGHRDGFFRVLKDIAEGDDILVQTTHGVEKYQVTDLKIVPKSDLSVLVESDEKMLTLVTCYPFYFVGHAPKRLIVTALPVSSAFELAAEP
jgi:LPXTG-site transpeptidase (sortase) family protein